MLRPLNNISCKKSVKVVSFKLKTVVDREKKLSIVLLSKEYTYLLNIIVLLLFFKP